MAVGVGQRIDLGLRQRQQRILRVHEDAGIGVARIAAPTLTVVVAPVFPASRAGRPAIGAGITRVVRQCVGMLQQEAGHQQAITRRCGDAGELMPQ